MVLFLALCLSLFFNVLLLAALGTKGSTAMSKSRFATTETKFEEEFLQRGSSENRIVVIPLDGLIAYGQPNTLGSSIVEDVQAALQQAVEDDTVKAIVVSANSPGGEITASDVIYNSIQTVAAKKPVIFYMNSIGTSGAYYAACGASWIMCNATTFTGSIGVIISTLNYRDLFGKVGLESVVFKSGKFKDMLNGSRELTPEESAYVQGMVMQSYDRFAGIVEKARPNINRANFRQDVADGRILSGTDALEAKLVDQLGYIEDAYAKARELAGVEDASVVIYRPLFRLGNLFRTLGMQSQAQPKMEIQLFQEAFRLQPGRVYLLPSVYVP